VQVDFYQLTRDPVEKVLPAIAQNVLDGGGRLMVISRDPSQLDLISTALWTAKPASFLAHARAGEADDGFQPILLSSDDKSANGAKFVALVDGEWRDSALEFDRAFYLFPPSHTDNARTAWRSLGQKEGVERRYWRQDGGKWVQGP
jgi:DNA polymerase III subunit chi